MFPNCLAILYVIYYTFISQSLLNSECGVLNKAVVTKYHKLCGVHKQIHCLVVLESEFEIKVLAGLVPSEVCEDRIFPGLSHFVDVIFMFI